MGSRRLPRRPPLPPARSSAHSMSWSSTCQDGSQWADLFGYPLPASAGLDRLTHGADVVLITRASYWAPRPAHPEREVPIERVDLS